MNIIDRYLLRQFLQNFVICFMSLTGVYVVLDAFTHLETFMSLGPKGLELMKVIAAFYGYQSLFFFDFISSMLVLMSAMFTMAWIQRHHEMTALMAAGISRIRVVAPVLVVSVAIILLAVINREIVIPRIKDQLAKRPADLKGNVIEELLPQYDNATNVLIEGRCAITDEKRIELPVFIVPPDEPSLCTYGKQWSATMAYYMPATAGRPTGYLLADVIEPKNLAQRPSLALDGRFVLITPHDHPEWLKPTEAFVVSDVTVDELTGGTVLRRFASTGELIWALKNHSIYFSPDVRVTIHSRILQALLDITLLFLGLPLVAARDNRNVFLAIGLCMGLVALFFMVAIACQQLGANCLISPALAAWAPLMIFVPAAVAMASAMWER
jgi:lipopolysaccharide export system permease protein